MTVAILLQGKLERASETRTSRNGHAFTMATLRVSAGSELQFWRIFVFSESAQAELARLGEGDALAVQGTPKFEIYERDGAARVSLSLTADHVLALLQPPKERKPKAEKPAAPPDLHSRAERRIGVSDPDISDDMRF